MKQSTSSTWKGIVKTTTKLSKWSNLQLGHDDHSLDIWTNFSWDFSMVYTLLLNQVKNFILNIIVPMSSHNSDGWCWTDTASGCYTTNLGEKYDLRPYVEDATTLLKIFSTPSEIVGTQLSFDIAWVSILKPSGVTNLSYLG
ncbi:hypothetical protein Lal_00016916 [Lupinus albus]|nr:hypothetical protein Lal_00016916 [Lupinus albus]